MPTNNDYGCKPCKRGDHANCRAHLEDCFCQEPDELHPEFDPAPEVA